MNSIYLGIYKAQTQTQSLFTKGVMYLFFLVSSFVTAQQSLSGSVVDPAGVPLAGVNVVIKGTNTGTSTDFDGNFSIEASSSDVLIFSFVGFKDQEVSVGDNSSFSISLEEEASFLDEIVVIGYGTVKKSDLTGSVASIDSEQLAKGAVAVRNPMEALNGLATGVQVSQNSGAPGAALSVRIRGGNSLLGNNEPLYVIDGVMLGSPNSINPNDIQSVEILKDASATAIYGSRGANGVVLITTKKGRPGKTSVEYDMFYGVQEAANTLDMLNATEFATLANVRAVNDGDSPFFSGSEINSFGEGTNWQDEVLRTSPVQNHTVTVSGGNEKTTFSISGNYFNQEGIIANSYYNRYLTRANFNHDISDKWSVALNSTLRNSTNNRLFSDNSSRGNGVLSGALVAPPTVTPYDENGNYNSISDYPFSPDISENPLVMAHERKDLNTTNNAIVNMFVDGEIVKNLSIRASLGFDYRTNRNDFYSSSKVRATASGSARISYNESRTLINENILTYKNSFNDIHNLTVMGGVTLQTTENQGVTAGSSVFLNDILENYNLQSGSAPSIPNSFYQDFSILSYLGRAMYDYQGKYLLTASFRADGSSRFGKENKWGYFPSAAVAWRVSDEDFLKDSEGLSNLKLRASWGMTGSTAVSPYQSLSTLQSVSVVFDNNLYTGFKPGTTMPNAGLQWETTTQTDIGIDVGFLGDRINATLDFYNKTTDDLLSRVTLPFSSGYRNITTNIGKVQNKGFEFSLNSVLVDKEIKWDLGFNFSVNRNEVLELAGGADIFGARMEHPLSGVAVNIVREGQPVGMFYGFVEEDSLTEDGLIQYKDTNDDGVVNDSDKTIIGNPNPDFIYGFNTSVSYKNLSLDILFSGVQGNDIFNFNTTTIADGFSYGLNQVRDVLGNYWTAENPDPNAKYPRISKNTQYRASDRYVEDGSYLRMRNIQLTYRLNDLASDWSWLNGSYIYISGQNLITITNYTGYTPNVSTRGGSNSISPGLDVFGYPDSRTFTLGIKLKL